MIPFKTKQGNNYLIDMDDEDNITVFNEQEQEVGSITLMRIESSDDYVDDCYYYVKNLSLDKCKRQGIGTKIFQLHKMCDS